MILKLLVGCEFGLQPEPAVVPPEQYFLSVLLCTGWSQETETGVNYTSCKF